MYVFELRDTTDEETYYSIGVYSTLELALDVLDVPEPPQTYNELHWWDQITFSIRQRPVDDRSENGREAATVTWTRLPIEDDDDEQRWERVVTIASEEE